MYLKSMNSVLGLVRFLKANPGWLVILNLRRKVDGKLCYKVPHRDTFNKFTRRLGPEKLVEIFSIIKLIRKKIIKEKEVED